MRSASPRALNFSISGYEVLCWFGGSGLGLRVQGLGFRGLGVQGFRGLGFRGLGFRALGVRV